MEQRLIQSPQMIHAMQILQLPTIDLQERIEQELTENPFLEVASEEEGAAGEEADPSEPEPVEEKRDDGLDEMIDTLERYERDFGETATRPSGGEDSDKKYEAMQNAPELPETLQQALIKQVALLELSMRERKLVEYLIWSLDDRGYLSQGLDELVADLAGEIEAPPLEREELENALARLRQVTHPAMAARDLRECLLLQLSSHDLDTVLMRQLISEHLDDLGTNRLPHIAKATGASIAEIKVALADMRLLDPLPGAEYGEARAAVITPDVMVEEQDGQYVVRLDRQRIPELTLSPAYRKLLRQAKKGDGVREWVKKRLESARWFIEAVQQRQSTLERIAHSIFRHQRDFLDRGISGLAPLRMQEVADEIGVHISTVSRGVSGKYAQTPRGIYPLKFYFTGGTQKESGQVASQVSIKELIREIVAQEDSGRPLSDDQIAAHLDRKDGLRIARRTVTKYRKALGIASSTQRRAY
jgi:RNA polymerase sigma-54 factor